MNRRKEEIEKAYQIQVAAGLRGAAQYGTAGAGLAAIAHYSWPAFRRQTLPFKVWLVSIDSTAKVSIFGLCIHAETALQAHEFEQRRLENSIRREARFDLARRGLVATETEIAKWKVERAARDASEQSTNPSTASER